jgi:hypothetical protein
VAAKRFDELVTTSGFMAISEESLASLLDHDMLVSRSEEAVWEALVIWMKADGTQLRGRGLLPRIRFPLMDEGYLRSKVAESIPPMYQDWINGLVAEALCAKVARGTGANFRATLLGPKALVRRVGPGVQWAKYAGGGGERRLDAYTARVTALAECEGRLCCGTWGGVEVWNGKTLQRERTLWVHGDSRVQALVAWGGRLISGHDGGDLRTWDVASGACEETVVGHAGGVLALAECGLRLVSGAGDGTVAVWAAPGARTRLVRERMLLAGSRIVSLAAWRGKVIAGACDGGIRVWDAATGSLDAMLTGHSSTVLGLAVHKDRLFSASHDGTVRVWAAEVWGEALQTVVAAGEPGMFPGCLAVCGPKLISGWGHRFSGGGRPSEVCLLYQNS